MNRVLVIVILAILLAPAASAREATGTLQVGGAVKIPSGAQVDADALALFVPMLQPGDLLVVEAARAQVQRHEAEGANVGALRVRPIERDATFPLTNLTLTLVRDPTGWLAVEPLAGGALFARRVLATTAEASRADAAALGNAAPGATGSEGAPAYSRTFSFPVMLAPAAGALALEGPLALTLYGPTVVMAADENRTEEETGARSGTADVSTSVVERWLHVEMDDARVSLLTLEPQQLVARTLHARVADAAVQLERVTGELRDGDAVYRADGGDFRIEGSFDVTLTPAAGQRVTEVTFQGELRAASMPAVFAPFEPQGGTLLLTLGGILAGGVVGVVTTMAIRARRATAATFSVDQLVVLAAEAAEAGDYASALDWTLAAQKLAPTSARLRIDEGFFHSALGETAAALAAYDRASEMDDTGEADFFATCLLRDMGDLDAAEPRFTRALDRTPSLAYEALDDAGFRALLERPRCRRAVRDALERLR